MRKFSVNRNDVINVSRKKNMSLYGLVRNYASSEDTMTRPSFEPGDQILENPLTDNSVDLFSEYQQRLLKACIVIPTYNEAKNLKKLFSLIYGKKGIAAKQSGFTKRGDKFLIQVLVVDDSSPDGTAGIVESHMIGNKNIHLLNRKNKEGLGAAYIAGFKYALEVIQPDIILEMDADLSHRPAYILSMIEKIKDGADFVIGSRYVPGGGIPANWGIKRKLISRSANLYARTALNLWDIKDCTGGFRAMRSSIFKSVDLDKLDVKGYAFQISLLYSVVQNDFKVEEVPIKFIDRSVGNSKMRIADMIELGYKVLSLGAGRMLESTPYDIVVDEEAFGAVPLPPTRMKR